MVYFRKTDVLDINEIVSFFRGALGQFADRSAKWLLANPDNLRGLLEIIKRADTSDPSVFVSVLETLGDHLSDMKESERAAWVQAVCYLYALVVHKRSVGERADLDRVVSEHQRNLEHFTRGGKSHANDG